MLGSFDRCNLMLRINVGNVRKMFGIVGSFDGCKYTWMLGKELGSFDRCKYMNVKNEC